MKLYEKHAVALSMIVWVGLLIIAFAQLDSDKKRIDHLNKMVDTQQKILVDHQIAIKKFEKQIWRELMEGSR